MHDTSQIDDAILDSVTPTWNKVAMVIIRAEKHLLGLIPEGEAGHFRIAERIEALVKDGHLTAQGNTKNWRHSEVRKP